MQPTGIRVSWQLRHYVVHYLLVYSYTVQSLPFLPIYNCLSPPWTIPCFCTNPSVPTCLFPPVWWCLPPVVGQQLGLHPTPLTYPTHLQDTSGKYLNCATSIDHVGCLVDKLCRHTYMVSLCISDHFMSCQFSCLPLPLAPPSAPLDLQLPYRTLCRYSWSLLVDPSHVCWEKT